MQDRYLFRGKRLDDGKWIYGGYCEISPPPQDFGELPPPQVCIFREYPNTLADWGMPRQMCLIDVDPATVGQCTGLHAAKSYRGEREADRLIFEGDIVKYQLGGNGSRWQRSVIVWGEKTTSFCFDSEDKGYCLDVANNAEIIGTIHDRTEGRKSNVANSNIG